jgi:hypothetical protein
MKNLRSSFAEYSTVQAAVVAGAASSTRLAGRG